MKKYVCFYHGGCMDGYGAAWVVGKKFGFDNVEFIPSKYDSDFTEGVEKDIKNGKYYDRVIYIVDFSFSYELIMDLSMSAHKVILYDHHISAQKTFEGKKFYINIFIHFDMEECGTSLTWKHLFDDEPLPWFIKYIKDRDLWQWNYDNTAAFSTFAYNKIFKPEDIEDLFVDVSSETVASYLEYGRVVLDDQKIRTERLLNEAYTIYFEGQLVPIVNCPKELMSDVGHELCKKFNSPFSITYRDIDGKRLFSLRGMGVIDLSELAKRHGGGGHHDAAGFSVSHDVYKYLNNGVAIK